jgi:hypothetical protein
MFYGATIFTKTAYSITTLRIKALIITGYSIMTLGITIRCTMGLFVTLSIMTFITMTLSVCRVLLLVKFYAECHYAKCRYADCRGAMFYACLNTPLILENFDLGQMF